MQQNHPGESAAIEVYGLESRRFSRDRLLRWVDGILPAIIGFLVFAFSLNLHILNPRNVQWLSSGDEAQHFIGLQFYIQDPWRFPPANMTGYGDGVPTSVVYTDSIPIVAIPLKWFVRTFGITEMVQPFGIFIAVCFVLQGVFAFKLLHFLTKNRGISLLGTILLLISPPLFFRLPGHLSLGAHWLILWAFYLFLKPEALTWKRNAVWIALFGIAAGIHFYLLVMCVAPYGAKLVLEVWKRRLGWKTLAVYTATLFVCIAIFGWFFGYFVGADSRGGGYGIYKFNLLSFFNPIEGWSRAIPGFRMATPEEYEGFAWFGLGILFVSFAASLRGALATLPPQHKGPLEKWTSPILVGILVGLLTIALTPHVNLGALSETRSLIFAACGVIVIIAYATANRLHSSTLWYRFFKIPLVGLFAIMALAAIIAFAILRWVPIGLLEITRSSGRLAWPVYYWFAIWVVSIVSLNFSKALAAVILSLCIAIQAVDIAPAIQRRRIERFTQSGPLTLESCRLHSQKITNALWDMRHSKRRLWIITEQFSPEEWDRLGMIAAQGGMKINRPYLARWSESGTRKREQRILDILHSGLIPDDVVYYIYPDARNHASIAMERFPSGIEFSEENGYILMSKAQNTSAMLAEKNLSRWRLSTPYLALEEGRPISFKSGGEASLVPGAISGFSGFGEDGVWTDGPLGIVNLKVPSSQMDASLVIKLGAFLNRGPKPGQTTKIFANGCAVGEWKFTTGDVIERELVIPKWCLSSDSIVTLRFEIENPASPKSFGLGSDPRKLGLCFYQIRIAQNSEDLPNNR